MAAAGVFGLIKAALALEHEIIPATLHYRAPNPQIDFGSTPFVPVKGNTDWPRGTQKRRAAVSSFGVGGTNAHVILEEAPAAPEPAEAGRAADDAGTGCCPCPRAAPRRCCTVRASWPTTSKPIPTCRCRTCSRRWFRGRQPMAHRLSVVARDAAGASAALRAARSSVQTAVAPRVVFLFPGRVRSIRAWCAGCMTRFLPSAPPSTPASTSSRASSTRRGAPWLIDADPADAGVAEKLAETRHAQPALFSVSYALAAWLESLGIEPDAMIGHSIGEYAAACRAGVFPWKRRSRPWSRAAGRCSNNRAAPCWRCRPMR
ncbi:acyltransferase domain-containing protein [Piscinibacter aquaticus]|uniref:Acyltransferase domain-containing protein n=1 Tax=Piscinibacter aquaticus TaxID=392597 RepID=A0A5C6U068_9BURK|nr:acyltransferase domain-containing protein [Piscinibacter aquaticus]